METITITLNGVEVSGYTGTTILNLARESGVHIPTLCDDPHLAPFGACRLCVVEDEKTGALLASCVNPIRPGMVINTRSPRVMERRKTILELMLASHPDSCLVCDKGNNCQLRQLAADMGVGLVRLQRIPQSGAIEEVNPFIERDLSKCIMCAKCIRADQELVVEGAIDYMGRGFAARPATFDNVPLERSECTFCGTCIAICPTGALREKVLAYRGATTRAIDTVCPYCGCGCNISLEVKDDRIIRVRSAESGGVNRGALCVRGAYGLDFVHSPRRLTAPLVRKNGALVPVSWEEALERAAAAIKVIKEKHGGDGLAVLGSPRCTNEENYILQKLAHFLGTSNIDNSGRLYSPASYSDGFLDMTSLDELESSDLIVVIGANPSESAPLVSYAIKRAVKFKGARLLLVDPRQTKLASFASIWLRPRVNTDIALINGLAKAIIGETPLDENFSPGTNFSEYTDSLRECTPEYAEHMTGVPAMNLRNAARLLTKARRISILSGNGISQQSRGTDCVMALSNLALLTRANILSLQRDSNARGAFEISRSSVSEGLTALEMFEQAAAGKLKSMIIVGENPVASFPNPALVKQALASLDFLLVSDMFPTETVQAATVVLPAASFAEKEGTFTSFDGRVQQIRPAMAPVGGSLPDWQIIARLSQKLGYPMSYSSAGEIMKEIQEVVPWFHRTAGGQEKQEKGAARFYPVKFSGATEGGTEYPLTLISGSVLYHFGSGTRSLMASRLSKFCLRGWLEINKDDAAALGFSDGSKINVISPHGKITTVVKLVETLPRGTLFMPISFPDTPVNELFGTVVKSCPVRLERAENG